VVSVVAVGVGRRIRGRFCRCRCREVGTDGVMTGTKLGSCIADAMMENYKYFLGLSDEIRGS
jgi:hypothetical protein